MAKTVENFENLRSTLRQWYDFDRHNGHGMECEYFNSFHYLEPDIQSGAITHADRPDFRIRVSNGVIGVEVTRLFTPLASPAIESTQDGILDQACSKAECLNLPPACVTLFSNLRVPLRTADRTRIADAVVQVVADNMPADGDTAELEGQPGQPSEVDLILIDRRYCEAPGSWRWDEARRIERDVSGIVQRAITEKANRLPTYLTCCGECWLLLVADSFRASGNLKFGEVGQMHALSSPFMRTYLLDFGRGHLYRLQNSGRFAITEPPDGRHVSA